MVHRYKDAESVSRAVAEAVLDAAQRTIHEKGDFKLVLAGGRTPRAAYELLSGEFRQELDWRRVTFYFGDERCVPPDDVESNYRMAKETLLDPLGLRGASVRRIATELDCEAAARDYDMELRHLRAERQPMFDLTLLGMGKEGHTASLFPGSPALEENTKNAAAVTVPAEPPERVTMTPPALRATRQLIFVVTGKEKAEALSKVFSDGTDTPAAQISRLAPSRFLVDEAAASKLPRN